MVATRRDGNARPRMVALLALSMLAPLCGSMAHGQSYAVGGSAVTASIHHPTKVITITARLLLYPHCAGARGICQITPTDVTNIKQKITDVWNNGHGFSCYEVRVDVQIAVGPQLPATGAAQVGIKLDQSPAPFESKEHSVKTVPNSTAQWTSDDPAHRLIPENNPNSPSTWGWPTPQGVDALAHEFGHILGLDDTYVKDANGNIVKDANGNPVDIPGSPHDVMNTGMYDGSGVSQETINRLVRRHGITESDLQCDGTISVEESVLTDSTHDFGGTKERLRQDAKRFVTVWFRDGKYQARTDVRGRHVHTQTVQSVNAAGQPCRVVSELITTFWGGGRGVAQVRIKDTVYLPATRAARAQGKRDTDYRIDVTLPAEESTAARESTLEDGCNTPLGNPPPETPQTDKHAEWTFTIEGHKPESATSYTGQCEKTVRTRDVANARLQSVLPCFRYPDMGNRQELWIMRHVPSATSFIDGGDVPFRVRTDWAIRGRS